MKKIGLIFPTKTPISPANWSGTPRGLYDGLASNGLEAIPIPCHLPEWARVPVALFARAGGARGEVAHHQPIYARARAVAIASAINRLRSLEGVVAMGTDLYDLPAVLRMTSVPAATYDDGTFDLFLRYRDSDISQKGLAVEQTERWAHRQGAACRAATVACVSTGWAKESIVEDFGVPEHKVRVVGMGHRARSVPEKPRTYEIPRFLFIGADWRRKNGAAVVAAFAQVRRCFPQATLDIVSQHPPLNEPGVSGHGFLPRESVAAQEQLDGLLARATAFVLPSLFEPFGIAYLEAASAGLPVIATTCGGAAELLQDGAIAVDPYDHAALVRAMLYVANKDNAQAMEKRARVLAAQCSWQAVSARIVQALEDSLADSNTTKNSA
jgi:glycosyltransferase involved in cell wall biosynthesis